MKKVNIPTIERKTMTAKECSIYLGISIDLTYILARERSIPHFKIGSRVLFKKEALDKWIENQMIESVKNEY